MKNDNKKKSPNPLLSKQYYILKMISQRTSFLNTMFKLDLFGDRKRLDLSKKYEFSIRNYFDYEKDLNNAKLIYNILSNTNNLIEIYNEIRKPFINITIKATKAISILEIIPTTLTNL